ncbi:hypothetical protein EJB05_16033 [Eragrostis curvula]|uniref:BHLH domain-containing protein n=1 Tax=Eragrostis curvula TaxID=38414 RepID=A0A5J9VD30_9POAL|nr:hypothetical protein EJB05_16033 [Eragrostis curvula]
MDEVWCDLDLQLPANGVAVDDVLHDSFWPAFADCTASFLAGDNSACFGVDMTGSANNKVAEDMVVDMDASYFMAEQDPLMMHQEATYSSSSLSSKRSPSIDSGGTTSFAHDPFAGDDAAIMRAMMAVLSSASPSSSESSSPPQSQGESSSAYPPSGNVMVRSSCSVAVAPERTASLTSSAGVGRQQQDGGNGNSSQMYHMMSERKRREKLNDSFHTLRTLLPPCSKKDKTTVLVNAASYLKKLETEVSELEEKNAKLERHVPREDCGAATSTAARAAAHRRAKVQISRAPSDADQVSLTVMVMVECDIVDLVLHVLERLRLMTGVSVLSVDADTYSPQVLLKAIASIKLQITDGDCWNEASFHEAMTKAVQDATSSPSPCASAAPLVAAA